ncbi:hypothetical protein LBMAG42_21550 [Deltaproteobacteria bacterium]|nr:hypothetical protein LBMAG42_21550 [Deltaproteobacteria bacterium]
MVVVVSLIVLVLLAFGALVLDLGYGRTVQAQLQAGTDAAALAGAAELDQSTAGLAAAREAAVEVAALNIANGDPLVLDANPSNAPDGDVVLGTWSGGVFTPSSNAAAVNSVLVRARSTGLLPFLSGAALGQGPLDAGAHTIARRGAEISASEVPWYLPFGLPECLFDSHTPGEILDMTFELNPAGVDNTGWALVEGTTSAASLISQLTAMLPCMREWATTGDVTQVCTQASAGDDLNLSNGDITSALKRLAELMVSDGIPWATVSDEALPPRHSGSAIPAAKYGKVLAGPLPIFDGGSAYCSEAGSWNEWRPVIGFAWVIIYDVRWQGSAKQKNVWVRIDPEGPYSVGTWFDGGSYGVVATGPAVVVQ